MVASLCLITCALAVGQPADRSEWLLTPQLLPGMELVYSGTYAEEALMPNVQYTRHYRLDTVLFVLDGSNRNWDVAFMTSLSLKEPNRGAKPEAKEIPASVRLEVAGLDGQGKLRSATSLVAPLMGPPTLECGVVLEAPITKVGRNQFWEVNEEGRPPRTWQVMGAEPCGGVTCIKLTGNQQSDDWDRPRADHTAWRRRDTVWLMPQLGVAQKVERVIERREPARRDPTQRTVLRYELESKLRYPGRLLEDRKQEILKAKKFQEDGRLLLAQPAQYRPQIEALLKRIAYYQDNNTPTPYRRALTALVTQLENARRGDTQPAHFDEEPRLATAVTLGQRVPDFVVTDLTGKDSARFSRFLGRPVLVFFYNPTTESGKDVLRFAQSLHQRHGDNLGLMAMAVTHDPDVARKQHAELKLPFTVLDGQGLHLTFGVEATPRLVVLDREGIVRGTFTGWGVQTPHEITEELKRCLPK